MKPSFSLAGKTAVVTGASSGIGRAVALRFAEQGADVFLHARSNGSGLAEVANRIEDHGQQTEHALIDLADPAGASQLVETAWRWRPIDIWMHAAGADVLTGDNAKKSFEEKFDLVCNVDIRATLLACREAGHRMRDRGGVILTIGWDQAAHGMEGDSGEMFAATKGAVMAFTKSLAKSLAPKVRVNCLAPGWIKTKWGNGAPEAWRRRAVAESLVGRWGKPEDIAAAAVYLASDEASFVTGQVLDINGGFNSSPNQY